MIDCSVSRRQFVLDQYFMDNLEISLEIVSWFGLFYIKNSSCCRINAYVRVLRNMMGEERQLTLPNLYRDNIKQ